MLDTQLMPYVRGENEGLNLRQNQVLVLQDEIEEADENGLVLTIRVTHDARPNRGTVFRTGPDCREVKEGQRVLFGKYGGINLELRHLADEFPPVAVGSPGRFGQWVLLRESEVLSEIPEDLVANTGEVLESGALSDVPDFA